MRSLTRAVSAFFRPDFFWYRRWPLHSHLDRNWNCPDNVGITSCLIWSFPYNAVCLHHPFRMLQAKEAKNCHMVYPDGHGSLASTGTWPCCCSDDWCFASWIVFSQSWICLACRSNSATWDLDLKLLDKTRLGVITVRCKFGIVLALIYWIPKGVEKGVNRVNRVNRVNWESRLFSRLGFYAGQPTRERARGFGQGWKAVTLGPRKTKLGPRSPRSGLPSWNSLGRKCFRILMSQTAQIQMLNVSKTASTSSTWVGLESVGSRYRDFCRPKRGLARQGSAFGLSWSQICWSLSPPDWDLWSTMVNPIQSAWIFNMRCVSIMFRCFYYPC